MSNQPFTTYLQTYRLRTGFSRSELAFLLGAIDAKTIRRHEINVRLPMLRKALGYSIVLGVSVEELYEGLLVEIHKELRARARGLRKQIRRRSLNAKNRRKIEILSRLAEDASSVMSL